MPEGQGFRARAHHLVGVAATLTGACTPGIAPCANRIRRVLPRASRRSLVGVDALGRSNAHGGNRRPGLYTPDRSGYAWLQNFNNGNQNNNNKSGSFRVRAVRT